LIAAGKTGQQPMGEAQPGRAAEGVLQAEDGVCRTAQTGKGAAQHEVGLWKEWELRRSFHGGL
jgi:hypothetical protein